MANTYDDSMVEFSRCKPWDFLNSFPRNHGDKFPPLEPDAPAHHVIHAIMAAADLVRATIIEESRKTREAIKQLHSQPSR
jgi:hypothetical protein